MKVFEQCLQLKIQFVCFAHIPIPSWSFWGGMSVKIIWIWHTAIVIAKNDQQWCFLGFISALNKIWVFFYTYPHPIMPFWGGMSVKIISIWHTGIVIAQNQQNNNNCSVSNPNDFNIHTSSKWAWWDGDMPKHTNFIQSGDHSGKTPLLVVFGCNNCSVSNRNDFNTYTSSKWAWWDGDMCKTHKFYSEQKWFLQNTIFGHYWL